MTFSAKKRFFEKEIEQTVQPATKPERRFSFLSEDEVEKLRQEEGSVIRRLVISAIISFDNFFVIVQKRKLPP